MLLFHCFLVILLFLLVWARPARAAKSRSQLPRPRICCFCWLRSEICCFLLMFVDFVVFVGLGQAGHKAFPWPNTWYRSGGGKSSLDMISGQATCASQQHILDLLATRLSHGLLLVLGSGAVAACLGSICFQVRRHAPRDIHLEQNIVFQQRDV